jgi:hypothetical protein
MSHVYQQVNSACRKRVAQVPNDEGFLLGRLRLMLNGVSSRLKSVAVLYGLSLTFAVAVVELSSAALSLWYCAMALLRSSGSLCCAKW